MVLLFGLALFLMAFVALLKWFERQSDCGLGHAAMVGHKAPQRRLSACCAYPYKSHVTFCSSISHGFLYMEKTILLFRLIATPISPLGFFHVDRPVASFPATLPCSHTDAKTLLLPASLFFPFWTTCPHASPRYVIATSLSCVCLPYSHLNTARPGKRYTPPSSISGLTDRHFPFCPRP